TLYHLKKVVPAQSMGMDARDAEQLCNNKVTHILCVHGSVRPLLEVRESYVF
uniref:Uncharacterized protein n=1 Tax=Ailuropoda melanoleuca TaxID=9646 RepID=A0A7N5K533_AILME